jgi:apolipoprotein N-acyltransferase
VAGRRGGGAGILHRGVPAGLAVLIHLWVRAPGARACAWLGFWFGLGLFGAGVSWVYISLTRFGGMPAPLGVIATLGFCALLALFPAAAGWFQARFAAGPGLRACLVIPAAWALAEWLRGWVLTGFPWLLAGHSTPGWPLQGFAPLAGTLGAGFATLCAAGCAWVFACHARRWIGLGALLAVLAAGEALRQAEWSAPAGDPLPVALLQGNVPQDLKFDPGRYARTLERYGALAEASRARLIVMPETALPRFHDLVEPAYYARLAEAARRNGGDLLIGVPYRAAPGAYFNSVLSLGASPAQRYDKAHLVPFGEFIPPGFDWVLRVLAVPLSDFSAGAPRQAPLQVAGQRVGVSVCYEDAYGELIARQLPQATLLVNVSNVAWFGDSLAPGQHLRIAQMRAIETARVHLTATNTGITAAIGRDGRVLERLPQFVEGRLEITVQGRQGATPYVRFGDWPMLALCLAVLGVAALRTRRR